MKKFITENMRIIIIILSILILLLIIIGLVLITNSTKDKNDQTDYTISNEVVELPGTKVLKSDKLAEEHCLDNICVSDVIIYTVNNEGRMECNITNKSNDTKSGYLRLKFNKESLIISYQDLLPDSSSKATAQYTNKKINDVDDYSLEKLTNEEQKSLIKSK